MESIRAVGTVTLFSGEQSVTAVRAWYEGKMGLKFVQADVDEICFVFELRNVAVKRTMRPELLLAAPDPLQEPHIGKLFLAVKNFRAALARLAEHCVQCEMLHAEEGMARMAYVADPAGNWNYLIETRTM